MKNSAAVPSGALAKRRLRNCIRHFLSLDVPSSVKPRLRCPPRRDATAPKTILWWQACRLRVLRIAADTAASTVKQMIKDRPHRLDLIYFRSPLFFVTFCTRNRTKIPSLHLAQGAIENCGRLGILNFDVAIGRYMIMPDHVHLFVRGDHGFVLSKWV